MYIDELDRVSLARPLVRVVIVVEGGIAVTIAIGPGVVLPFAVPVPGVGIPFDAPAPATPAPLPAAPAIADPVRVVVAVARVLLGVKICKRLPIPSRRQHCSRGGRAVGGGRSANNQEKRRSLGHTTEEAKKTAEVVRRGRAEPGSYGG